MKPKRLYHGTEKNISGRVLPARETGVESNFAGMQHYGGETEDFAFAAPTEKGAWAYADQNAYKGRARVYEVAPHPDMQIGAEGWGEYLAPHYDVTNRIDIKPPRLDWASNTHRHYQGTIPSENWNTHVKVDTPEDRRRAIRSGDLNHPYYDRDDPDQLVSRADAEIPRHEWKAGERAEPAPVSDSQFGEVEGQGTLF